MVNVWGSSIPYLKSVDDSYESGRSWHYNWTVTLTASKIKDIMNSRGNNLGDIIGMDITKVSAAGRATELVIKGTANQATYTREKTRTVFSLDSQWYTISSDADKTVMNANGTKAKIRLSGRNAMTAGGG